MATGGTRGAEVGGAARLDVLHVDAERGFSGGEEQVFLLMEGLRRAGHAGRLACPPGSACERAARARGFPTLALGLRSDLDLATVLRLWAHLRERPPDLVHLHTGRATWLGGLAAFLAGVPAVTTRRMDRRVRRGPRTRWIYGAFTRRVAAISPAVARALSAAGVPAERIVTIPSAVDPAALLAARPRDEVRAELGVAPGEFVVLSLSALVRRKGLDVLIDAADELPGHVRVLIAGAGPAEAELRARAARSRARARIAFLGFRSDRAELFLACDAFVLPSRREGLGVAALEAMAAGRPVVAARVGGLAEAVQEGRTGLLVEPDDPAALARAVRRLVDDGALGARLGAAGPAHVAAAHSPEALVAAYEALYRAALAPPGSPEPSPSGLRP